MVVPDPAHMGFGVLSHQESCPPSGGPGPRDKGIRVLKRAIGQRKKKKRAIEGQNGQLRVETQSSKARSTMVTLFYRAECMEETEPGLYKSLKENTYFSCVDVHHSGV